MRNKKKVSKQNQKLPGNKELLETFRLANLRSIANEDGIGPKK